MKIEKQLRPPRISRWVLGRMTFRDEDFSLIGDFEEEFLDLAEREGEKAARKWYRRQMIRSLPPVVRDSIAGMFSLSRIYFKLARRNLLKHKFFSMVNIAGLAVGLACCTLIIIYVTHELTFDRHHPDYDRIYRINTVRTGGGFGELRIATSPAPLQPVLESKYPQVAHAARMIPPMENGDNVLVQYKDRRFTENRIFFADPDILSIFEISIVSGQSSSALVRPNTVMITKTMAEKYFGGENPMGKFLRMELDYDRPPAPIEDFEVTAVIGDPPTNTHLPFDMLVSMATMLSHSPRLNEDWLEFHDKYTYIKLNPGQGADAFERALQAEARHPGEALSRRQGREYRFRHEIQPVARIHMDSSFRREPTATGNWYYIYIYSIIALLILAIGCMNFLNLSTVLSSTRTREVAVLKVTGAYRRDLVWQFLGESFLIALAAFMGAFLVTTWLLSLFNQMAGTHLTVAYLNHPAVIVSLAGLLLLVVLGAGYYPAFVLSSYSPVHVERGEKGGKSRGTTAQKLLVVGQFAISIFLAVCSLTVYRQLGFMKGQALGFEAAQKIILQVKSNTDYFRRNHEAIKKDLIGHPHVLGAAVSSWVPGDQDSGGYYLTPLAGGERKRLKVLCVDHDFLKEYGIPVVAGRAFQKSLKSDENNAYLINETALGELEFHTAEEALGKRYTAHYHRMTKEIVGVVRDVYFRGMREKVEPILFDLEKSLYTKISLKVDTSRLDEILPFIRERWARHFPGAPFEYSFLDDDFDRIYHYEEKMGHLLGVITGFGLTIACLGLLGLVSFMASIRQKELGIRKVLGASVADVVYLISRRFIRLVFVASVLALPLAWVAMNRWLQDFVRRIDLGPFLFLLTAGFALLIALVTLVFQGIRVASRNPLDAIRYE